MGNSRNIFGTPLDQKRRGGSTYSDAHHFQVTPVTIPRPRDLPHCSENFEPARKSTPVVQAPLSEEVRRDLDLIDQIANSRAKQREKRYYFQGLVSGRQFLEQIFPFSPRSWP